VFESHFSISPVRDIKL